jgi:choline-sulfatase
MRSESISRRQFCAWAGYAVAAMMGGCCTRRRQSSESQRPNILFIMTDDQGPWAMGSGHPNAYTPHLDQLAQQGVRLANAMVTTPVCSPARAGFLTGRYSTEAGVLDWLNENTEPEHGLDPQFAAWPRCFAEAGYHTALIGKWHLGMQDCYHPSHFGYHEFTGFRVGAKVSKDPQIEVNGKLQQHEGFTTDLLTDYALGFIARSRDVPFVLSLHTWAPHANVGVFTEDGDRTWHPLSEADWDRFRDIDPQLPHPDYPNLDIARSKRMTREYLASVAEVDRNVGRLLQRLDELGIAEHTIVIFTSDNGYSMAHNGIWHKGNGRWLLRENQGSRPNLYDNSLRVPAVIRWPGRLPAGRTVEQVVQNLDWFATLLDMAGIAVPAEAVIHGRSFKPLLDGQRIAWDNSFFGQYTMLHDDRAVLRCFRTPQWKLIRDFSQPGRDELYDLVKDPDESHNLIGSEDQAVQKIVLQLNRELQARMIQIADYPHAGEVQ